MQSHSTIHTQQLPMFYGFYHQSSFDHCYQRYFDHYYMQTAVDDFGSFSDLVFVFTMFFQSFLTYAVVFSYAVEL